MKTTFLASFFSLPKLLKYPPKASIYRGTSCKRQSVKSCLEPINKLEMSCKASFAAVLGCFHRYSCRKMGQKACVNKTQVAAEIQEYATREYATSSHVFMESRFHFYTLGTTSTAIFSMMEAELALVQNMKVVSI